MPKQTADAKLQRLEANRQALLREMAAVDEKIQNVRHGMGRLNAQILSFSQKQPTRKRRQAA